MGIIPMLDDVTWARLLALPRAPEFVLDGTIRDLSNPVREGNEVIYPSIILWMDSMRDTVRAHGLISPTRDSEEDLEEILETSIDALVDPSPAEDGEPALPARVRVDSPILASAISPVFDPLGIPIEIVAALPAVDEAFAALDGFQNVGWRPFTWDLDPSLLLPLFEAADAFSRERPWTYMADFPPIAVDLGVDAPQKAARTLYGCVLGNMGTMFGIAFYFSRAAVERTLASGDLLDERDAELEYMRSEMLKMLSAQGIPVDQIPEPMLEQLLDQVVVASAPGLLAPPALEHSLLAYFEDIAEADPSYVAWMDQLDLPRAEDGAIPIFVRVMAKARPRELNAREVRAMTLALRAATAFLQQHRTEIARAEADPTVEIDVLKSPVPVGENRTIAVRWPGM